MENRVSRALELALTGEVELAVDAESSFVAEAPGGCGLALMSARMNPDEEDSWVAAAVSPGESVGGQIDPVVEGAKGVFRTQRQAASVVEQADYSKAGDQDRAVGDWIAPRFALVAAWAEPECLGTVAAQASGAADFS